MAKKKITNKSKSTQAGELVNWNHLFGMFSYRNRVVFLSLLALTVVALTFLISAWAGSYTLLKIGGVVALALMLHALNISIKHTRSAYLGVRKVYFVSDVMYGSFSFLLFIFIMILQ